MTTPLSTESPKLVGRHEIADLLGVSRQRVYQLTSRPDFPAPIARLHMGDVWRYDDVAAWIAGRKT